MKGKMINMIEEWKISTYPTLYPKHYAISNMGRLKNLKTGRILKPYVHKITNYEVIKLKSIDPNDPVNSIKYKNFFIHKLVGWEYCEMHPGKHMCNHIDGNKRNNVYTNLEWCTAGENTRHALRTGLTKIYGEDNPGNKYSESFVRSICEMFQDGKTKADILKIITDNPRARSRSYPELYTLLVHLHSKDRFTSICNEYNYNSCLTFKGDDEISKLIRSGYENIEIMHVYGYNHIDENTKLYTRILNTRKILTQVQRSGKPN